MCGTGDWKREIVPDHKFDFIDIREFADNSFGMRLKYLWLYALVLKSFLVYVSDIFTAVTMLTTNSWSNQIFNDCPDLDGCVAIPFNVGKWLFVGCIIFSFLLLAYEARKSKKIIASHDISYAFTNIMANHYYSLRSYDHFCFFDHISRSTKKSDDFAFFIFFTFKDWKRLLLADAPRQTINALTLYAIYLSKKDDNRPWYFLNKYFAGNTLITTALTISTLFTVLVCAGSLLLLFVAGVLYIPLLCRIKGNLKEYCCHKVDKRIAESIKRRNKQRMARAASLARKEAAGDFSHLKNKKGEFTQQPLPQPTLPNISLDDDDFSDVASSRTRALAPSTHHGDQYYPGDNKSAFDYPTMPAYNQPYSSHQDPHNPYAHYNPSGLSLQEDYVDEYGSSQSHLPSGAAPYGHQGDSAYQSSGYVADPYDIYTGHTGAEQPPAATPHQQPYQQQYFADSAFGLPTPAQDLPPRNSPSPQPPAYRTPSPGQQAYYQDPGHKGGHTTYAV